jgi:hypothetical protein
MRTLTLAVLLLAIAGIATTQTVTVTNTSPPEAKLAAIDAKSKVVQQRPSGDMPACWMVSTGSARRTELRSGPLR